MEEKEKYRTILLEKRMEAYNKWKSDFNIG